MAGNFWMSIAAAKQFSRNILHGANCASPRQRQAFKNLSIRMVAAAGDHPNCVVMPFRRGLIHAAA